MCLRHFIFCQISRPRWHPGCQVKRREEKTDKRNSKINLDRIKFKWWITMTYTFPWWFWHHRLWVEFGHFHKARTRLETEIVGNSTHISIAMPMHCLSWLISYLKKSKRFWCSKVTVGELNLSVFLWESRFVRIILNPLVKVNKTYVFSVFYPSFTFLRLPDINQNQTLIYFLGKTLVERNELQLFFTWYWEWNKILFF